jgi:decaprenylphospho-beta-D-erythro-pentofuranosid-2-ulose 2-reductase
MKNKIVVMGATSAIALATIRLFARDGHDLFLVGRNSSRLATIVQDLRLRSTGKILYQVCDMSNTDQHDTLFQQIQQEFGDPDMMLIAYGSLPDQKMCEASFDNTREALQINFISVISLLTLWANYFEKRKRGCLAVITSVAGDRGRQSNYVYGTAKGGLAIFLQGLRNRLTKANVRVLTIKPGFVDTPMTKDFKKGILWASPEGVAKSIYRAMQKNEQTLYIPFFWRYIMLIIKSIPERIFCRLSL